MIEIDKREYDNMARLSLDVLSDYGFFHFPLDVFALAKKIGMNPVPYSSLTLGRRISLFRYDMVYGLTISHREGGYTIYDTFYNDVIMVEAAQRFTIAHEIKHIVAGDHRTKDLTEKDERLADYFARSLLAPPAIIIQEGLSSPEEYIDRFHISRQAAEFSYSAAEHRKSIFGEQYLFDYEQEFLENVRKYG